jgi:crotonobetainyl-CoA:carnitine CoA-transferase CaiB-like acyl-CoA transferase
VSVAFTTPDGRDELRRLVAEADVVIEASRPRALEALGFAPAAFCAARPGRTWVSITGHGRRGPRANWVAFGDDAAAAGGLVARDRRGDPVFCADAAADPVSGLYAAVGALASLSAGGGHLVDCAMARAAAYAGAGASCRRPHGVEHDGEGWVVAHLDRAGGSARVRQPCP